MTFSCLTARIKLAPASYQPSLRSGHQPKERGAVSSQILPVFPVSHTLQGRKDLGFFLLNKNNQNQKNLTKMAPRPRTASEIDNSKINLIEVFQELDNEIPPMRLISFERNSNISDPRLQQQV